jgi:hypothetical protein
MTYTIELGPDEIELLRDLRRGSGYTDEQVLSYAAARGLREMTADALREPVTDGPV